MNRHLLILEPKSSTISSTGRVSDLFFRSDTFSAALLSVLAQMGEPLDDITKGYSLAGNPPFRVSSAFPVLLSNQSVEVFYPVPELLKIQAISGQDRKEVKRVLFADKDWILKALTGEQSLQGKTIAWEGSALVLQDARHKSGFQKRILAVMATRPGLAVDRWTEGPAESYFFEYEDILIEDDALHLGVILECEQEWMEKIKKAVIILGLSGIGPKRSTGHGQFILKCVQHPPGPIGKGAFLLLSLYHPTRREFDDGILKSSIYRLVQRSGYITSPGAMSLRRGRVTMIAEGAVLKSRPEGEVICLLTPGPDVPFLRHPVYRDGRAVTVEIPAVEV